MLRSDGAVVWIRDEARLATEEGRAVWQGVLIDITAERALTDAYDNYRSLVESLPACLYRSESGSPGAGGSSRRRWSGSPAGRRRS